MKTKTILKYFALFLALGIMSCGSDDDSGTGTGTGDATATSIAVVSTSTSLTVGDSATFTVTDNLGNDVSGNSVFTIGGVTVASPYVFNTSGTFVVTVTNGELSTTITVVVEELVTGSTRTFTTKILLGDHTGAWCGACPTAGVKIHAAKAGNANIIPVAYHNDDSMDNADASAVENYFSPPGFPTVNINGKAGSWSWSDFPMSELSMFLFSVQPTGLAINSTVNGDNLDITVKVGFANITDTNLKLTVYLVEDGRVESQANYYEDGPNPNPNYVHDDILRKSYTAPMGDVIPAESIVVDGDYVKTFTGVAIPSGVNTANLRLVAFVSDADNKVLNIQTAGTGVDKDFD